MAEGRDEPLPARRSDDQWREGDVSLRQLYLTLRAGLPVVVLFALACAVPALVFVNNQDPRFVSAATVTVSPPPVGSSSLSGLELSVPSGLDFDTYRAIAFDAELIDDLAERHGTEGVELLGHLELRSRTPASQVRGHLTVEHVVNGALTGITAREAADIANDWAGVTSDIVASVMTTPIDRAIEAVTVETAARKAEFDAASEAWSGFLGVDERRALNDNLDALAELGNAQRARLAELESAVAAASARSAALQGALSSRAPGSSTVVPSSTQLIEDQLAVLVGELAALQAERDHLAEVLERTADEAEALRGRLTDLEGRAATLQRDLASASMTFYRVAPAGSTLQLQRDLVARSASVAVPAAVPLLPEPRARLVVVAGAAIAGGLLATLFVFLRAAVRDPER